MNNIINKISKIILGYGEHAYETESKRLKKTDWRAIISPDKNED